MWIECWICSGLLAHVLGKPYADEAIFTVNSRALNHVSDKFLSISLDPAVLLTGLNLSDTSLQMAQHLSPSYIRLAGASTKFVKYVDSDDPTLDQTSDDPASIVVTPSMWFGITEWFLLANLTPIFAINDVDRTNGEWDPKAMLPLLELTDKLNVSCYWQLGYDCSDKSETQYKEDLVVLRHILDAFPDKKNTWKVVGSDLSKCTNMNLLESPRKILNDLEPSIAGVAIEAEDDTSLEHISASTLLFSPIKPKIPLWITMPKEPHTISFGSALTWIKAVSEAAKLGYQVVFRQPRLHEIFTDTPVYWASLIYKKLMGTAVLEVKSTNYNSQMSVFANCAKRQNKFVRSGAVTVLVINNGTNNGTLFLRLGVSHLRSTEVQSYHLTSSSLLSTDTYLNGQKLILDLDLPSPKLRRTRSLNYFSLTVPPESISFFILTTAQLPVCVQQENEMQLLMDELYEDQNIQFSDEITVNSRNHAKKSPSLKELKRAIEQEIQSDEQYYNRNINKLRHKPKTVTEERTDQPPAKEARNFFIERAKMAQRQRKQLDYEAKRGNIKQIFGDKFEEQVAKSDSPKRELELELSSAEIRKILADRAKAKAAKKNIIFTSEELDEIMDKITDKYLNNKNTAIKINSKIKRDTPRDKKDINMRLLKLKTLGDKHKLMMQNWAKSHKLLLAPSALKRHTRDINMDLLKLKADPVPVKQKLKISNLRLSSQSDDVQKEENRFPDGEIYAELSNSAEITSTTKAPKFGEFKSKVKLPNLLNPVSAKQILSKFEIRLPPVKPMGVAKPEMSIFTRHSTTTSTVAPLPESEFPTNTVYMQESEESDEFGGNFDAALDDEPYSCIHEYMGLEPNSTEEISSDKELWELVPAQERVPNLANRNFKEFTDKGFKAVDDMMDFAIDVDYGDLDSNENLPLRLKRDIDDTAANLKNHQTIMLKHKLSNNKINFVTKELEARVVRHKRDLFTKKYKSLTKGLKSWKPSDILSLKAKNFAKRAKLAERSLDNDVHSIENEIDGDVKKYKTDMDKGDYQLVFPGSREQNGTDDMLEILSEPVVKLMENELEHFSSNDTGNMKMTNIQKISQKPLEKIWHNLLRTVTDFFHNLGCKIKTYYVNRLTQKNA